MIRNNSKFKNAKKIILYTCNSGNPSGDGKSIGQKLANLICKSVDAPNGYVHWYINQGVVAQLGGGSAPWVSSSGDPVVAPADGQMLSFDPETTSNQ
jgi:hypothetical protein